MIVDNLYDLNLNNDLETLDYTTAIFGQDLLVSAIINNGSSHANN
jgi:hypothetical protein